MSNNRCIKCNYFDRSQQHVYCEKCLEWQKNNVDQKDVALDDLAASFKVVAPIKDLEIKVN